MRIRGVFLSVAAVTLCGQTSDQLLRLRTLGKAFYENPTTQTQAVEQFKQAWQLNSKSPVDRLNYALALLRAGNGKDGVAELVSRVQKNLRFKCPNWAAKFRVDAPPMLEDAGGAG